MTFITKYRLLFVILFSILSLTAVAQTKKTVAVLDPICRDNTVNTFFRQMVRGAMESAVTNSEEYEAYDRSAFDLIQKEHAFQQSGVVNDSQIKKMGEMAGVDYVLVSEVSSYDGYLSAVVKILNVTTGKYDKSVDDYTQLNPEAVKQKCDELARMLFGDMKNDISSNKEITRNNAVNNQNKTKEAEKSTKEAKQQQLKSQGYVDLGLPSGTWWRVNPESTTQVPLSDVVHKELLPTVFQMRELIQSCQWERNGHGYIAIGPNGNRISFPATYSYKDWGKMKYCGHYLTSEMGTVLWFHDDCSSVKMHSWDHGGAVRFVSTP